MRVVVNDQSPRKCVFKRKLAQQRPRRSWRDVFDRWMLLQMLAIFCMSFGVGMLFMQGSVLWHQYKHGYGYFATDFPTMEEMLKARVLSKLAADPHIYQWSQGQLKVNTSLFIH